MTFKKIEERNLPDIQSQGIIYEHEETGAKVLRLANDDSNKAFTIGFRTPPYSDNGIAHILEHAVLNGSEGYPSKEPFVEIIKGSLNTFINALTYSDKTVYPVASTNQKDFMNLMSVYMDAVFRPNMRGDEQILAQEGWHYHLEDPEDDLTYKGVVYNEMKGATASPERQLYQHLSSVLYKGSIYEHESGGHPRAIPELTQEEFVDFHSKYYHPSNSLTVLYGDLDDEAAFAKLEEYFSNYQAQEPAQLAFEVEAPADPVFKDTYSITEGDSPEDKTYLTLAWHTELPGEDLKSYGLRVLSEILFGNNESPLKKALLEAEIGGDIDGGSEGFGYPSAFVITAKYSDASKMEQFKEVVDTTLKGLVTDGIPKDLITAALNKINFSLKENAISESNPRGVLYAIQALGNWLYDASPYAAFEFSHYMDELAKKAEEGYLEELIQTLILDNPIHAEFTLEAEPGKNDKIESALHDKLQEYKASLSEDEVKAIVDETQALIQRQETPDKQEDLDKIPSLTREDLTTETEEYPLSISELEGMGTFYHGEQFTSGIDYVEFYFDISDIPAEHYTLLAYVANQLTQLSTENYPLGELRVEIDSYTGGIRAGINIYEDQDQVVKPFFYLGGKTLEDSLDKLLELIKEVATKTRFDLAHELKANTQRMISNFEQQIDYRSNGLVADRALSQIRPSAKLAQAVNGIDSFLNLKELQATIKSDDITDLEEQMTAALNKVITKERLNVLYIGDAERGATVKSVVESTFADLPQGGVGEPVEYKAGKRQNEAFVTAQDVNYVGLGAEAEGILPYNGTSYLLRTIASYDYLWNVIRVQGGAYGAGYRHDRSNRVVFTSYRDPNIAKTLESYRKLPDYIESLEMKEEELLKNTIGSFSNLIQPLAASDKGKMAFVMHMTGVEHEDLVRLKEELLATTLDDLKALAQPLAQVIEGGTVAVIGNKQQIENNKDLFDSVTELY